MIFRLQRKANDPAASLFRTQRCHHIVSFHQVQIDRLARFGDLVRLDAHGSVVAWGRRADQAVAFLELFSRSDEHLLG